MSRNHTDIPGVYNTTMLYASRHSPLSSLPPHSPRYSLPQRVRLLPNNNQHTTHSTSVLHTYHQSTTLKALLDSLLATLGPLYSTTTFRSVHNPVYPYSHSISVPATQTIVSPTSVTYLKPSYSHSHSSSSYSLNFAIDKSLLGQRKLVVP
ncbi:hypothetical protein JAAARDRAFT_32818 [Jaapia argillacea MUCL 33604]|uniref:Uncharacterized protein n=1 Tax=Jaapia argillacea MUCL 33604 TaxID=933084 RepID=A0A067QCX9_9AGAM|nr:hypothetical protein JAAARDRAFT_32818 [Jaapia argillacea MUCL 33604]